MGRRGREKKLTKFTASAFVVTTRNSIAAANHLFQNHGFHYILPAVFSTNPLEKFFGNARKRKGGNFYIDIIGVIAAAKAQRLHQLVKHNILPDANIESKRNCLICEANIEDDDVNLIDGLYITSTQTLLESDDTLKHKVVYIAGFLARRYEQAETDEVLPTGFLDELNRGGLSMPTLGTVYFIHCAVTLQEMIPEPRQRCGKYFQRLLALIDSPMAKNEKACSTLKNTLFKAFVLQNSDQEKQIGCLRRREKLS